MLLTATFCLLAGGAVMVYSASSARTLLEGQGDGTAYLVKYLCYGAAGLVAMHVLSRVGLEHVRRYTPWLLLAAGHQTCIRQPAPDASRYVARASSRKWSPRSSYERYWS